MTVSATATADQMSAVRTFEFTDAEADLANELGLNLTVSKHQRLMDVASRFNAAVKNVVEAGVILLSIKDECNHGEFGDELETFGITRQRASEAMRYAKFTAALPDKDRNKVLELPKRRVLALASTEPAVIEAALDDEELFDDLANMDYQAMRKRLRQLENRNADLEVELDTAKSQNDQLQDRLSQEHAGGQYPEFVMAIRQESNALATEINLCVDDLERNFAELGELHGTVDQTHFDIALTALYTQVNAASTRAYALARQIHKGSDIGMLDGVTSDQLFTDDEVTQAVNDRELLIRDHEQEKRIRENEREMKKPRGRGRPKKQK